MMGPKMQEFCPRINMLKGNCFKTILRWIMVCHKMPKLYLQNQFSMSKIDVIFQQKQKTFKNINLGDHFYKEIFFLTSICEPLYFLKSCPILFTNWSSPYSQNTMISFEYIDFWPKSLLFRTHHLKIPQPNWY